MRVQLCFASCGQKLKNSAQDASVLTARFIISKKSVFKERVRTLSRLQRAKNSQEGGRQNFPRAMLQNLWGWRGAGPPAPTHINQKNSQNLLLGKAFFV